MGRTKRISDEELLALARAAFVEQGLRASTREIARRAGVSEAVLFQRFGTKTELFLAAMVPPGLGVAGLLPEHAERCTGEESIRHLVLTLTEYFRRAAPVLVQLIAHEEFRFEEFAAAHPGHPLVTLRPELMAAVSWLKAERKIGTAVDVSGAALAIFAATYSIALFERMGAHGGRMPEMFIESMAHTLWAGLQPSGKASAE